MPHRVCHACGARGVPDDPVPRESTCSQCGADLRCCRNCRHWDARYNNECRETQAEPVLDKKRRNFCEFFQYSEAPFVGAPATDRAADARAKLAALFRKKE